MKIDVLLQRLELEQSKLAANSLAHPSGKDGFDYGRAVGMYAGIEHAKRTLIELVAEKERKDFNL
jgi:hypothetical protein